MQAAIALPEIAALEIVPAGTATPAKVIPTLTALQEPVLAVAALVTAMDNAVVPVQRLLATWVASLAASAGSKVDWITVPIFNPAAWATTLVTHLTVALFSLVQHQHK